MNNVNISLNQEELNALGQLLDVAVKATGISGAKAALAIMAKLEEAVSKANEPVTVETKEGQE